jgi:hypothetical protein
MNEGASRGVLKLNTRVSSRKGVNCALTVQQVANASPDVTRVQATRALVAIALNLGGSLPVMTHARAAGILGTQVSGSSQAPPSPVIKYGERLHIFPFILVREVAHCLNAGR